MPGETEPHGFTRGPLPRVAYGSQNVCGQVQSFEELDHVGFGRGRDLQQIEQRRLGASCTRALISSALADRACAAGGATSSGMSLSLSHSNCELRGRLRRFHFQWNQPRVRRHSLESLVDCRVKEFAAPHGPARFCDRNFAVAHFQAGEHALGQLGERLGSIGQNRATNRIAVVPQFRDERENAREHVVWILHYPIEHPIPLRTTEPLQHTLGEGRLRTAVFFGAHHGGKSTTPNVECAALIAEPRAAAAGASRFTARIPAVRRRAGDRSRE